MSRPPASRVACHFVAADHGGQPTGTSKIAASFLPLTFKFHCALGYSPESMIDELVVAGYVYFELDDSGPARGTLIVCTPLTGSDSKVPQAHALSKISPMTWKLDVRFGPPSTK